MPPPGTLRTIDAAEEFAVMVNQWLATRARNPTYAEQLRRAAGSVSANLTEGYARGPGADSNRVFRIAKSECEETLDWLRKSKRLGQITMKDFHRLSNRGIVIIRMVNALMT